MHRIIHSSILMLAIILVAPARAEPRDEVDLLLVLAADVSGSMSAGMRSAQRKGFAEAFRNESLRLAVVSGPLGRISATYFEWAGQAQQRMLVPWSTLSEPADFERFAAALEYAPDAAFGSATSIFGALDFAADLVAASPAGAFRKVVDISGNGRNSDGPAPSLARARLRQAGVTVNGLVLSGAGFERQGPYAMLFTGYDGPLDDYYRKQVIGGPGSFAVQVDPERGFAEAILRKLVMEIAWTGPEG